MKRVIAFLFGLFMLLPQAAKAVSVDLELVLAVDVSRSIDDEEFLLQRKGYSDAFKNPRVIDAIRSGALGRIAVCLMEWGGVGTQTVILPWRVIDSAKAARDFAEAILLPPRIYMNWTSVSGAIDYSAKLFDDNGFEGARLVIDVSGDGVNNSGRPAAEARDEAVARGITINGLAIKNDKPNPSGWRQPAAPPLDEYYEKNVIGGPGAFMIVTNGFEDFAAAVTAKLVREIAGRDGLPGQNLAFMDEAFMDGSAE